MAKKRRHRTWWFPVFTKEIGEIQKHNELPLFNDGGSALLFDQKMVAYGFAVGKRLDVQRNEEGVVVTNDKGYAQLEDHGKITLIGIKGSTIDWKQVSVVDDKPESVKGEAIVVGYNIPVNKQTLDKVFEETDEMYNRYAGTPLAKAGGIEKIDEPSIDATKTLQLTTES